MLAQEHHLSPEDVRVIFSYDPAEPHLRWAQRVARCALVGKVAGSTHKSGYVQVRVRGLLIFAHRLIWAHAMGKWPEHEIDHINGVVGDNRIVNLRDVDRKTNAQNKPLTSKSKTGARGVYHSFGKYRARIWVGDRNIQVGSFDRVEDAAAAYAEAKRRFHAGFSGAR